MKLEHDENAEDEDGDTIDEANTEVSMRLFKQLFNCYKIIRERDC